MENFMFDRKADRDKQKAEMAKRSQQAKEKARQMNAAKKIQHSFRVILQKQLFSRSRMADCSTK